MSKYFDWTPLTETFIPGETRISYGGAMIGQEEIDAILDVITSQGGRRWTVGPESIAFEKELAQAAQVKRAVVTNSGSSALLVGIGALGMRYGSIIIPATNFPTAYNSIRQNNYNPEVVDTDPKTFLLDLDKTEELLENTKCRLSGTSVGAILAVNIAGNVVDVDRLLELRDKYGVLLILDNCDGFGSLWKGKPVESYFDVSMISFHAAHIITTGEGGAVLTNNDKLADKAISLREWGRAAGTDAPYNYPGLPAGYRSRYVYENIGYNLKPLELQCAMGRVQLRKLEEFRKKRLENYNKLLKVFDKYKYDYSEKEFLFPVLGLDYADVCWFGFPFVVKGERRDQLMDFLESRNIETRNVFSGNILRHPAYSFSSKRAFDFKGADDVMKNGMFISNHPSLTDEMIKYIDSSIHEFLVTK